MSSDTLPPDGDREPVPGPPARRLAVTRGAAVAVVACVLVAVGGAVAWAVGGDDDPVPDAAGATAAMSPAAADHPADDDAADDDAADGDGSADHDHDDTAADGADPGDDSETAGEGRAGRGTEGRGRHQAHEPLPPYEERYREASDDDREAADALLADVRSTLTAYADADAAVAAGYQPPRRPHGSFTTHYLDQAAARDDQVLDPAHPEGLVYYTGGEGDPVLLGAFFVAPPGTPAPPPAGDLVVWHSHQPSCAGFFATEDEPCTDARRMLHVWTAEQVDLVARRTGQPTAVRVTDPFGAPFIRSVEPAG